MNLNIENNYKILGLVFGFIFGVCVLVFGFFKALFVGLLALAGWWIGKVFEGEVDVKALTDQFNLPARRP